MLSYDKFLETVEVKLRTNTLKKTGWFRIAFKQNWEYLYEYAKGNKSVNHALLSLMLCPKEKDKEKKPIYWSTKQAYLEQEITQFNTLVKSPVMRQTIISIHFDLWRAGVRRLNPEYERTIKREIGLE